MTDKHEDAGLFERLTKINNDYPGANIILHKLGVMPQVRKSFGRVGNFPRNLKCVKTENFNLTLISASKIFEGV